PTALERALPVGRHRQAADAADHHPDRGAHDRAADAARDERHGIAADRQRRDEYPGADPDGSADDRAGRDTRSDEPWNAGVPASRVLALGGTLGLRALE